MTSPLLGIFIGTFDPIHLGHLHLANSMSKLCGLQKILFVPCYNSPLRTPPIASAKDRFHMAQLALKNLPQFAACNYETRQSTISYTINTLKYLRKKYMMPLALIMGIDAFNKFHKWYQWQTILSLTHLLVSNRPTHLITSNKKIKKILATSQITTPQELQKKTAGLIYLADIEPLPIAATNIRAIIKQQQDASNMLTKEVWHYIKNNNLYLGTKK